jgi:nitroimidazol reductase NimA-like FMN-containing flavoprotein (pyridoxamine 5'-phosphate oxidase superfamily)
MAMNSTPAPSLPVGAPESADESENDSVALDSVACWQFLGTSGVGRLAISVEDGVDIFPINYLARDGRIYFRSAPGTKIAELTQSPRVAFESDGRTMLARWSVVVRGTAHRLNSDAEIAQSGIEALHAWQPGDKFNYFEIRPELVTGRFIRPRD